ncbi:DUF1722 domain-containing protein [Idiomarina sp.]|uniref:YbgA family protein n=1 Tax=Idiomarina sp. TaxID=1874361 RepID=UPI002638DE4C|nr:DUF1722 domain-containing protein [Idiomarina sp.]
MRLKVGISSCLMGDEVRFDGGHKRSAFATGIFASRLRENNPAMPLEEDGRLNDPHLRENFIMRVYVYGQWKQIEDTPTKNNLLSFHSSCKLLLLAHNQQRYRELGKRLGEADTVDAEFATQYIRDVMEALSEPASRRNHTNVLQHIQGYLNPYPVDLKLRYGL